MGNECFMYMIVLNEMTWLILFIYVVFPQTKSIICFIAMQTYKELILKIMIHVVYLEFS